MSFIAELKRRNVIRMAGLYLVGAWLIVQVAGTLLPVFDAPAWVMKSLVILMAVGFVPALIFSWAFELTPDGLKRDADVSPQESIAPQTAQRMNRAIIAVLALALLYFGFDKFVLAPRREAVQIAQVIHSTAQQAATGQSIAVLPLTNESGDKEQQYFSDGLSENLIVALSQFSGLKVIGRNSSFQFRDSKDDSKTIGAQLGVATLLEGSVQHAGDSVRISAELIRASDGSTIWTQSYDRPYKDLFALQDEITRSVAGALESKLLANEHAAAQTDRPPSGNLEAYSAYLRGQSGYARRTEQGERQAIDDFSAATRLDPHYAQAYAGLSLAWLRYAGQFLDYDHALQAFVKSRAAADAAMAWGPDLAVAHEAHATVLREADFDWNGANAEYRRALELAPNDAETKISFTAMQAALGRPERAMELTRQALAIEPRDPTTWLYLSRYLAQLGRLDEAAQAIRKAIELQPDAVGMYQQLTAVEVLRGDARAALAAAQQEPPGYWRYIAMAQALQIGSDKAAADAALKILIDKGAHFSDYQIAEVQALRKDSDQMFAWLDRAWTDRDSGLQFLLYDPFILRYKDNPRFAAFCKKVGLPTPAEAAASGASASGGTDASTAASASGQR